MFKVIFTFGVVLAVILEYLVPVTSQEPDTPIIDQVGIEVFYATLEEDTTVSGTVKTNNIFKDTATGYGIYIVKGWTENIAQTYGWSSVAFGGKNFIDDSGDVFDFDGIKSNAYYTGIVVQTDYDSFIQAYGRLDIGVSVLNDVGYLLTDSIGPIEDRGFSGGTGLYYAAGLGAMIELNDSWAIDVSYKFRNFGKLKGVNRTLITKDQKVEVSSVDLGILYKF